MKQENNLFSSNYSIALLTLASGVVFLFILLLNIFQPQNISSRAKSTGCNQNLDCPEGAICSGGLCTIAKPLPTQSPLAYVDVSKISEVPESIPNVYSNPTPTPKVDLLPYLSQKINGSLGSFFSAARDTIENIGWWIASLAIKHD